MTDIMSRFLLGIDQPSNGTLMTLDEMSLGRQNNFFLWLLPERWSGYALILHQQVDGIFADCGNGEGNVDAVVVGRILNLDRDVALVGAFLQRPRITTDKNRCITLTTTNNRLNRAETFGTFWGKIRHFSPGIFLLWFNSNKSLCVIRLADVNDRNESERKEKIGDALQETEDAFVWKFLLFRDSSGAVGCQSQWSGVVYENQQVDTCCMWRESNVVESATNWKQVKPQKNISVFDYDICGPKGCVIRHGPRMKQLLWQVDREQETEPTSVPSGKFSAS